MPDLLMSPGRRGSLRAWEDYYAQLKGLPQNDPAVRQRLAEAQRVLGLPLDNSAQARQALRSQASQTPSSAGKAEAPLLPPVAGNETFWGAVTPDRVREFWAARGGQVPPPSPQPWDERSKR